jgi:3-methylfumaryl-CoA hydratase
MPSGGQFNPDEWSRHRLLTPSEPLLFRFSALTFNSHRIHYDLPYARDAERYRGLVVHGPLMASLLLQLAGPLQRFAFRAVSPAIAGEPLHLVLRKEGGGIVLGAFAGDGRQIVHAEAAR